MKAKRLCAMAIVLCMVLWMMPVGAFATEEMSDECICLTSCSEEDVNEDCDICSRDYKKCEKTKQRTVASTEEAKTSTTTAEKKEQVTTKATTEKKEEVTTEATTEKKEEVTTEATTEKKEEVTTEATTEKKEEVTTEATTEKKEEVTTEATADKEKDIIAQGNEGDLEDTKETSVDINETNFPDEAFRSWIINYISGADDKALTSEEIEAVKSIDVSGQGIKSLAGIKQFKHLETLDCSNNNLKTLDLTGLEALKTVNAGGQDGGTATVVEEENGWKLDMEKVVGEDNLKNVTFADGSLPEGSKYQYGVVAFSEEPDSDVTYGYKTGTDTVMEVTLKLDKKALPEIYTITLDEEAFNFGKKCIDITPSKASIEIKNNSDESINFQVVSTSEASNYVISKKEGAIATESTEIIEIGPKEGLKAGEYKESFSIKVDGEEAKTFNASFQVVEHDKKEAWSSDDEKHWHVCQNCETKLDVSEHSGGSANCVDKAVCEVCDKAYGEVDSSNHEDLVKVPAKAATHTSEGNITYWYCRDCKKYFTDNNGSVGTEISSSKVVIAKTGTHTADGNGWRRDEDAHWQVCACGEKINRAAHSFVWKVDQQATATKNGYGHNECSVCGYKKASVIIAATGTTATSTTRTVTATTAKSLLSKIIPTTGDDSHIALWLGVLVICGVTILGALGRYFSKRK